MSEFIIQLDSKTWRSRPFDVTSFKTRATKFKSMKGAKISLARLRRYTGADSYPDAIIKELNQ